MLQYAGLNTLHPFLSASKEGPVIPGRYLIQSDNDISCFIPNRFLEKPFIVKVLLIV